MERRAFGYDIASKSYIEFKNPAFVASEIENVPVHFIVWTEEEVSSEFKPIVWCDKHQTFENVKNFENFHITTDTDCEMEGLLGAGYLLSGERNHEIPVLKPRWRAVYNKNVGTVFISKDIPKITWSRIFDEKQKVSSLIPKIIDFRSEGVTFRFKDMFIHSSKNCVDIPNPVAMAAIEFLLDAAEIELGARPHLPKSINTSVFSGGRDKIEAFLNYPMDMNLWPLRTYFDNGRQYRDFLSRTSKDSFVKLCEAFKIEPTNTLKEAYEIYPFSIPITAMLNALGVEKPEFIARFLPMTKMAGDDIPKGCANLFQNLLNIYAYDIIRTEKFPREMFSDDEAIRVMLTSRHGYYTAEKWRAFVFYSNWYLSRTNEEKLSEHLLQLLNNWEDKYFSFMNFFYNYYPDIPKDMREEIITNGLLDNVANKMIDFINSKKCGQSDFTYTEEDRKYEVKIDGFEFRLTQSSDEFSYALRKQSCMPNNMPKIKNDGVLRFIVSKDGKLAACLVVGDIIKVIYSVNGIRYYQEIYPAQIRILILRFLKYTGLYKKYGPFYESDYEFLDEDVKGEPLPKSKDLKLYELLNLSEKDTKPGFYVKLRSMFFDMKLVSRMTPPPESFVSEIDYLKAVFPLGEKIYKAAFDGKREAQKALSLMYGEYETRSVLPHNKERYEYWKKKYQEEVGKENFI